MIVISLAMIMMISMVNAYGVDYASAYGAALQLWTYIQMPAMAIGAACSSMAAQNVGAGQWDRVNATARTGTLVNFLMTGALIAPVILFDPRSEEHTSELQSLMRISYAVFCLTQKNTTTESTPPHRH